MEWRVVDKHEFLEIVNSVSYKDDDEKEAMEFSKSDVKYIYNKSMNHKYAKYYVVEHAGLVLSTIALQRDGYLIYFVTKDFTADLALSMVRCVKSLADTTVERVDVIFVKTAIWYDEAKRFVRLTGFSTMFISTNYIIWKYLKTANSAESTEPALPVNPEND